MEKSDSLQKRGNQGVEPAEDPPTNETPIKESEIINRPEYRTPGEGEGYVERFRETTGIVLAVFFSGVFFIILLAFFLGWLFTRPSFEDVKSLSTGNPSTLLEYYKTLCQNHLDGFTKAVRVILTPFVPLYSFILGYVFKESRRLKRKKNKKINPAT